ncbi:hypothetical protein HGH93_05995 [Chitinophaga polysaccharea]|uniref:hypothetical protein n=1 Tax=Chitinophaga polysaccharea TaxID=1293035 RepID=UPI001455216D|nr:hypothetical protein [Chitinophaga polysaccharea]NLR57640.1 hypothetical protein [Chitinophaga polysaccharea]
MPLEIIGKALDLRTNSHIIYGQIEIPEYLEIIGSNFDEYNIQRKKEKHKAYSRMKTDIIKGALLPTITLAINQHLVSEVVSLIKEEKSDLLKEALQRPGSFSILDGLQRTYILNEIRNEGHQFKEGQRLLLEFWIEPEIKHLIYRLIVLNAGQKPMTLRHQLELLFMTLAEKLKERIPNLDLHNEVDERRRTKPCQYAFERLVTSYQSFLWKTSELNKDNIIAQQLMEESVLDANEESLNNTFEEFTKYFKVYTILDEKCYNIYSGAQATKANWLATENVMNSFFAAISDFSTSTAREDRVNAALNKLMIDLPSLKDPMGIDIFDRVMSGIQTKKLNVGVATRKLLFTGFKEFFREEGEKSLADCWKSES